MTAASTISVLNRLVPALQRTLPAYLRDARPWTYPGRELALETLIEVGQQQVETAERLSSWIIENRGIPDQGDFPLNFTQYSDLSIDYLVRESLRRQEQLIKLLASGVDQLHLAPHAQALVQEALGEAKAHRDMLREAQAPATARH